MLKTVLYKGTIAILGIWSISVLLTRTVPNNWHHFEQNQPIWIWIVTFEPRNTVNITSTDRENVELKYTGVSPDLTARRDWACPWCTLEDDFWCWVKVWSLEATRSVLIILSWSQGWLHAIRDIQTQWLPRTMISVFISVWTRLEIFYNVEFGWFYIMHWTYWDLNSAKFTELIFD